jgi:flagellar biosynthesis GTPase FlhF
MVAKAEALPAVIENDAEMGSFAVTIKELRDTAARAEAFRVAEKEPHYRAAQAVDAFFAPLRDRCARPDRRAKPGAADVLQERLDAYNQRKLQEEMARRRREAEEQERIAREARERAERERAAAEEARRAAERARKPETVEQKSAEATERERAADSSLIEADRAMADAETAGIATLAKASDIVRTRVEGGPLVTMAQEGYAEVVDSSALDRDALWPYISENEKEKAVRLWAKNTGFRQQMAGAKIGKRNKSVVR